MYASPKKKEKKFTAYWNKFIIIIAKKEGFNDIVLKNLEILCDLYIDYDDLTAILKEEGWTTTSDTRYGTQHRSHPAAGERTKILSDIRHYSKLLGVKISTIEAPEEVENEWD